MNVLHHYFHLNMTFQLNRSHLFKYISMAVILILCLIKSIIKSYKNVPLLVTRIVISAVKPWWLSILWKAIFCRIKICTKDHVFFLQLLHSAIMRRDLVFNIKQNWKYFSIQWRIDFWCVCVCANRHNQIGIMPLFVNWPIKTSISSEGSNCIYKCYTAFIKCKATSRNDNT